MLTHGVERTQRIQGQPPPIDQQDVLTNLAFKLNYSRSESLVREASFIAANYPPEKRQIAI
jgi:hypothetical protein